MKIGTIELDNPLVLAPMAGITQLPLRLLAREHGCALVVSEMISANGLIHRGKKTLELLKSDPAERPLSVQLFGMEPAVLRDAAQIVQAEGADMVDINLGCSVRKVLKQGAGVALMQDPKRLEAILKAMRGALAIPLTAKLRSGWDGSGEQAVAIARIAQDCGVDGIAIHPRTARQGFAGKADWSLIARLKEAVSIPVIGNGDVRTPEDVVRMLRQTGCDAVMIGRAAVGNPWIFSETLALMNGRTPVTPSPAMRLEVSLRYVDCAIDHFGEQRAVRMMRTHLAWFVKGLAGAAAFRDTLVRLATRQDVADALRAYFEALPLPD
jgi:tRNA-dihydrouridine synthase B